MRDSRPQLLDNFFSDNNLLQNVQQRAIVLSKLNKTVKSLLPTQLQSHCRVANYRNGILVLETSSANWLMALRYEHTKLLSTLRADILPSIIAIDIKVNPSLLSGNDIQPIKSVAAPEQTERKISANTAVLLNELADHCPDRLKLKLKRLAELAGESANTTSLKSK